MTHLQRRDALLSGGAAAGLLLLKQHRFALAAQTEERVIPWVDQPPPVPPPAQKAIHNLTPWERLDSWILAQKEAELESYTLGGASTEWLVTAKVSLRGYHYHSCDKAPILPRARLPERKLRAPTIDELLAPKGTYEKQVVLIGLGSNMPGEPALQAGNVEQTIRRIRSRANTIEAGTSEIQRNIIAERVLKMPKGR